MGYDLSRCRDWGWGIYEAPSACLPRPMRLSWTGTRGPCSMTKSAHKFLAALLLAAPLVAASLPAAKPEDVGMSTDRLKRIGQMVQRRIDAGDLSGAVTIVARK